MKQALRNVLVGGLGAAFQVAGSRGRRFAGEALRNGGDDALWYEPQITIDTKRGPMTFSGASALVQWRAETLLTKEPETIEWIDGFGPDDVLFDVGANIGLYTLYAAKGGQTAYAFEPLAANYFILDRNTQLNGVADRVRAFCLAISDKTGADTLNIQNAGVGSALNCFGGTVDESGREFVPAHTQACIGYSIDDFIKAFSAPVPQHLKIDVDGIEDKVLRGAPTTLRDSRLRSVSIEMDDNNAAQNTSLDKMLQDAGLRQHWKRQGAMMARGPYKSFFNCLYTR